MCEGTIAPTITVKNEAVHLVQQGLLVLLRSLLHCEARVATIMCPIEQLRYLLCAYIIQSDRTGVFLNYFCPRSPAVLSTVAVPLDDEATAIVSGCREQRFAAFSRPDCLVQCPDGLCKWSLLSARLLRATLLAKPLALTWPEAVAARGAITGQALVHFRTCALLQCACGEKLFRVFLRCCGLPPERRLAGIAHSVHLPLLFATLDSRIMTFFVDCSGMQSAGLPCYGSSLLRLHLNYRINNT